MTLSSSTQTWHWQDWQGLPYLTCSLLSDWQHGFFTSHFTPDPPEKLVAALNPDAPVYRVKQVHGNTVLTPGEIATAKQDNSEVYPLADGTITQQSNQAVWVASADCTPALIADTRTGNVAAVHAGWRGTAQKIVPVAIQRFLDSGSVLGDLRVALGPAIAPEVYQVSEQVAIEVGKSLLKDPSPDTPEAILAHLEAMPDSPIHPDPQPGRRRLDVRRVNQLQLEQMGMKDGQIAIAPYCTYQHAEHFHSYRRTKAKKVQWSGIVSY
jgi:YfiH family protein